MVGARAGWVERRAMLGSGSAARLAATVLGRRLRSGNMYLHVHPVARLLWRARDEEVVRIAEAALERAWDRSSDGPHAVWYGLLKAAAGDPPPAVLRLLLASTPDSHYVPRVRIMGAPGGHSDLIGWVGNPAIAEVLRTTDHPDLLYALEEAFISGLRRDGAGLWTGTEPTPLLRTLVDNPHLSRPPRIAQPSLNLEATELAVLAILKDRPDLLHHHHPTILVRTLVRTAGRPLPPAVTDACRRALRELPAGDGRDALCALAMEGDAEARDAVVDTGWVPAARHRLALFLFCTEQWKRYDRVDPRGAKLLKYRNDYTYTDWVRLREVAVRAGRRHPKKPAPPPVRAEWPHKPARYRPGGTGTSGSGGFGNPGSMVGGFGI